MHYVFADCELDTQSYELRRPACVIRLRPKVFQVLAYLLAQRDRVVSKHELLEAVWPAQYISDATLADTIRSIRRVVGDTTRQSHIIETRHGHGYRFVAEVTIGPPGAPEEQEALAPASVASSTTPPVVEAPVPIVGEQKVVTVLCVTLGQSAVLLAQQGLDVLHTLIRTRYEIVTREVQQYAGTVQPLVGDRALAVFGVPMTHEDHAQRAGLAALAIRERLETQSQAYDAACQEALTLRGGLHTGQVAVVDMNPVSPPTPLVVGEAITLAMALQEHAAPGTILCSEATARRLQEVASVVAERTPLSLPTQPAPVQVYTLLAPRPLDRPQYHERPFSPFVGRAQELATLQALLAQVHEGQGHVVGIVGEPGIGKSRLLYEFRKSQQHHPLTYLASQCLSYGTTTPYGPVRQLLRQLCDLTEADDAEMVAQKVARCLDAAQMAPDQWAPLLLDLLGQASMAFPVATLSPQEHRERTFTALVQLCVQRSQSEPLVLEIENLHWMDATSEAWLAALVERIASRAILLLSSFRPGYRPPWMGASYVTQLALARLSVPESKQVLQAVPRVVQLPEAFTQVLLRKADGNPFFLEELTQAAVERSLDQIPEMPEIPETVQAVLAARIDRLPAPEKRLLQVAAVIGQDITLPLLSEVTGLPPTELHQGLHYLQTAEFLYETVFFPTPLYTFKHALTQEVAYQSLLPSTRQPYHQHIAQLLSTRFPDTATLHPERLAHHYTETGLLAQALPYWQQAGEQAAARSANVEAISHFTRGLEALQGLPVTPARHQHELALQLALSVPLFMLKQNTSLVNLAQRVLVLCRELRESVTHYTGLAGVWRFFFNTGQLHKAQELGQQCLTLAQHVDDPALWLEAHTMQGSTALTFGELCCAQDHFQHSVRLYTTYRIPRAAHQVVDPGVLCFGRQAYTLWLLGYADQALAAVNQALALAKATGHTYSLGFALLSTGTIHRWRREIKALQEDMHALLTLARQHAFAYYLSAGLFFQGLALVEQGAPAPGLAQMHEARATWEAQGATYNLTAYYTACAHTYHLCGETEAGLRVLDDATILMESTAERYYEAEVYRLRGELLCHPSVRDTQQAEACFHQACAIAARQHAKAWELRAVMSLCRLWQQQGKHLAARQRLASVYSWFTEGFTTRDLLEARDLVHKSVSGT